MGHSPGNPTRPGPVRVPLSFHFRITRVTVFPQYDDPGSLVSTRDHTTSGDCRKRRKTNTTVRTEERGAEIAKRADRDGERDCVGRCKSEFGGLLLLSPPHILVLLLRPCYDLYL